MEKQGWGGSAFDFDLARKANPPRGRLMQDIEPTQRAAAFCKVG
ncbi:hypothetical protein LC55x_0061 [Lysobacter capsici]|nr:hypothetical protein LC55x_0061 [Lysobacter capsici]